MEHRHIDSTGTYTLPEIDDIIDRGSWEDWLAMREVADTDDALVERILHICKHRIKSEYDQKYFLWQLYGQNRR